MIRGTNVESAELLLSRLPTRSRTIGTQRTDRIASPHPDRAAVSEDRVVAPEQRVGGETRALGAASAEPPFLALPQHLRTVILQRYVDPEDAPNLSVTCRRLQAELGPHAPIGQDHLVRRYRRAVDDRRMDWETIARRREEALEHMPDRAAHPGAEFTPDPRMTETLVAEFKRRGTETPTMATDHWNWENLPLAAPSGSSEALQTRLARRFAAPRAGNKPLPTSMAQWRTALCADPALKPVLFDTLAQRCPPRYAARLIGAASGLPGGMGAAALRSLFLRTPGASDIAETAYRSFREATRALPHGERTAILARTVYMITGRRHEELKADLAALRPERSPESVVDEMMRLRRMRDVGRDRDPHELMISETIGGRDEAHRRRRNRNEQTHLDNMKSENDLIG